MGVPSVLPGDILGASQGSPLGDTLWTSKGPLGPCRGNYSYLMKRAIADFIGLNKGSFDFIGLHKIYLDFITSHQDVPRGYPGNSWGPKGAQKEECRVPKYLHGARSTWAYKGHLQCQLAAGGIEMTRPVLGVLIHIADVLVPCPHMFPSALIYLIRICSQGTMHVFGHLMCPLLGALEPPRDPRGSPEIILGTFQGPPGNPLGTS